jgi:hypothetical protein
MQNDMLNMQTMQNKNAKYDASAQKYAKEICKIFKIKCAKCAK